MEPLILGIDLCDTYSQISVFSPESGTAEPILLGEGENSSLISTVLCKMKGSDTWLIGYEAYRRALMGEGTMVDKLVKLLYKNGNATIEGVQYSAEELMGHYIEQLLKLPREKYGVEEVRCLAITLRQLSPDLLDRLTRACDRCGLSRSKLRFLSHTESFAFFVASRPKEIWPNMVVGFDLGEEGLDYYEMRIVRADGHIEMGKARQVAHDRIELRLTGLVMRRFHLEYRRFLKPIRRKGNGDRRSAAECRHILRAEDGRAVFGPGFHDFQEIVDFLRSERFLQQPVVQDEQICLGISLQRLPAPLVSSAQIHIIQQVLHPNIADMVELPASCVPKGTSDVGFPAAGSTRQDDMVAIVNVGAGSQTHQHRPVQPAVFQVFNSLHDSGRSMPSAVMVWGEKHFRWLQDIR